MRNRRSTLRNVASVTSNLDTEMDALQDDELNAVSGGRKTSTAKTNTLRDRMKTFEQHVQDGIVTEGEY
jgi:hypothetical protein